MSALIKQLNVLPGHTFRIFIGKPGLIARGYRPVDADGRVIPCQGYLAGGMVDIGAVVRGVP